MINHGYGGITLRAVDSEDMDQLRKWRNDYRIWKWCRQNDLIADVNQSRWFEKQAADPTIKMYTVWNDNNTLVGCCGLTSIDQTNQHAEFSVYIAPEFQKRGYCSNALRTLFSHGFFNLNLNLIWGETFAGNPGAKIFSRIGMKEEGFRRDFYYREGRFLGCTLYSITRAEWFKDVPLCSA